MSATATVSASGDTGTWGSYGLSATTVVVSGGTLEATGGTATNRKSSGVYFGSDNASLTITGGTVTAAGGDALSVSESGNSSGVDFSDYRNNLTVSGGTLTASGTSAAMTGTPTFSGNPKTGYTLTGVAANFFSVSDAKSVSNDADSGVVTAVFPATAAAPTPPSYDTPSTAPVTEIKNSGSTTGSNLDQLVADGKTLTVDGDNGAKLVFEPDALKGIAGQTSGDIKVEMKDVSPVHQENLPGKQVFSLTVSSGSGAITNFGGAVTVTLPYTLRDGETANEVTVWYLSGDGTMTELPCTYDPATGLATFKVTHFSLYVVGTEPWVNPFTDVSENDWFYDAVRYVSRSGLMQGTGAAFSSGAATTRGMLVTILWRLENASAPLKALSFTDVSGDADYAGAVAWAAENGIVGGYGDGNFGPDDSLTREQLAAILYRYAGYKGYDVTGEADLSRFSDSNSISSYAQTAMHWANAGKLINGTDGNLLNPLGDAARCQVAAILQRFIENAAK